MQLEVGQLQKPIKAVLKPLFNFAWRVSTDGLENIPTDGGAIIAPNHLSVLDSFFVPCSLPRRITYVGKAEYLDDWKTKVLFPAMGMIPIDRRGGEHAQAALDAAAVSYTHLRAHESVLELVCRPLLEKKNNKLTTPAEVGQRCGQDG